MDLAEAFEELSCELSLSKGICEAVEKSLDSNNCDELEAIYEGAFLRAFRAYENFTEAVFIAFMSGCSNHSEVGIDRFVKDVDAGRARKMLIGEVRYLDWTDASKVTTRCQAFFKEDSVLESAIRAFAQEIKWMKVVRNQIAHNSIESRISYNKVVGEILLIEPKDVPPPGAFLRKRPTCGPMNGRIVFREFVERIEKYGSAVASG